MNTELKVLIEKAENEIERTANYLKENEHIFKAMDLKLKDAYYGVDINDGSYPKLAHIQSNLNDCLFSELFYNLCEQFYDELRLETNYTVQVRHIGRTSKFNLNIKSNLLCSDIFDVEYNELFIYNSIFNVIAMNHACNSFDEITLDGKIVYDEDEIDYRDLHYIIEYLYNDTHELVESIKETYDYIMDVKNNQVELFREFLNYYESMTEIYNKTIETYRFI